MDDATRNQGSYFQCTAVVASYHRLPPEVRGQQTICTLKAILGSIAADIIFRFDERPEQLLFVMGDFEKDTRSHHIHVVLYGSDEWNNYINFRDYLNSNIKAAREYEAVKLKLAEQYPDDRIAYTDGKKDIIDRLLAEARVWKIESSKDFHDAVLSHQEPICPACGKGRIICPQGKIKKPHYFECSNNCGWHMNVDYKDCLVE